MSMPIPLMLGGVALDAEGGPVQQGYEDMGGSVILRFSDGAGLMSSAWARQRITVSGSGWVEPAVDGLDFTGPLELRCIKPRWVQAAGLVVTLPASMVRPDDAPVGYAVVRGLLVETAAARAGDDLHLAAVAGASAYRVSYLPVYQVLTRGVVSTFDEASGRYSWTLEAEQV